MKKAFKKLTPALFIPSLLILSLMTSLFGGVIPAYAQSAAEQKAQLEAELKALEKEIAEKEALLSQQKQQTGSIQRDIDVLTTEINRAKLSIQSKNLAIGKLKKEIENKSLTIYELGEKMEREKASLAQLIRKTDEIDDASLVNVVLGNDTLSGFYQDVDSFTSIKGAIKESVDEIKLARAKTEEERQALKEKQDAEADARAALESEKKRVEQSEKEKQQLLSISKNKEAEYQKLVEERKAKAAQIRSRLFQLAGGVQGGGIPFGDAVQYAEYASQKTGVRAAFILGILKQETNLGSNVGLCMLTNAETGESRGINTGTVFSNGMKPTRDVQPFLALTKKLGLDPYQTRISCPIANVPGWGGAMGPSQFIPSTWAIFADRIANNFGVSVANPWNPQHAIMATAVYLQDLGAAKGGYTAERDAACRYYSGVSCTHPTVKNAFYGNAVMAHAATMEEEIKFIKEN